MGKALVAIDKDGAISENALKSDGFLVLKDGQLEKVLKNDLDTIKPAHLAKICKRLNAEALVSGGFESNVAAKLLGVELIEMTAGTSPAWREEEYPRNKIDNMWQNVIDPLLKNGGSVVVQPMPEGDIGQLDWQDGQVRFNASLATSLDPVLAQDLIEYWPQTECALNVILQNGIHPNVIAYDLLWFGEKDYGAHKYIDRLAKLAKILEGKSLSPYISLIGGKVFRSQASFNEFKETVDWAFRQKDIAYVAIRNLDSPYEEPAYLKKSEGAWRIVAPPTRTLLDLLGHPFKILRELREEK